MLEAREDCTVVGEASNGAEAVALVMEKRPDIVLMDINLPKLSGIDAVRSGASYLSPAITQQVVDAIARSGDAGPSCLGRNRDGSVRNSVDGARERPLGLAA